MVEFIFSPTPRWHTVLPTLDATFGSSTSNITPSKLTKLIEHATFLHNKDTRVFQDFSSSPSSELSFLTKIIQSGTVSDRLSALTLLIQSSPLHNLKALETIKGMAERGKGKGGRSDCLNALRCFVDWWVGGGVPEKKLRYFRDQPLAHPQVTDQYFLVWYFEDWLKKYFFSILQILETLSLDPLSYIRTQSLNLIFILLRDRPEQEQNLLRLLVNKLGDAEKSLCSRSSWHILQLLQAHPSMKTVVTREIEANIFKPSSGGRNEHTRYYACITLNQIFLSSGDQDVARKLIEIYFEVFKEILGERTDTSFTDCEVLEKNINQESIEKYGKMKIINGIAVKDKKGRILEKGKKRGKFIDQTKCKNSRTAGAAGFMESEDANSKLISAILTGVNRALPFVKVDAGDFGINKHIDTLFRIVHNSTFNISLQALVLIQQISFSLTSRKTRKVLSNSITDRYFRALYASLHDPRLWCSSKQAMYLNLLFKSLKGDIGYVDKDERLKAIVRRFVQVLVIGGGGGGATEFVAGGLYLLGEVFKAVPSLRELVSTKPTRAKSSERSETEGYDPNKRDPQYARASASPLWEVTPLLHHFHPTIALHARQLLFGQSLTASADLSHNTLSHFLDRFVYKNPKQSKLNDGNSEHGMGRTKGGSAMQPAASGYFGGGVKIRKGEVSEVGGVLMNEDRFLKKRVEDVPPDQIFFHKYFLGKNERDMAKAKAGKKTQEVSESADGVENESKEHRYDDEDARSELDEDEVWEVMMASMATSHHDLTEDDNGELPNDLEDDVDWDAGVEEEEEEVIIGNDEKMTEGEIVEEWEESDDNKTTYEWGGIGINGENFIGSIETRKRRGFHEEGRKRQKKLRSLPTFVSYEDYANLVENGFEDDI